MTDQCPRCPHPLHQHHACTARNGGTANPCPCLGSQAPEPTSVAPATAAAFMGCFGGYVEVGKARSNLEAAVDALVATVGEALRS